MLDFKEIRPTLLSLKWDKIGTWLQECIIYSTMQLPMILNRRHLSCWKPLQCIEKYATVAIRHERLFQLLHLNWRTVESTLQSLKILANESDNALECRVGSTIVITTNGLYGHFSYKYSSYTLFNCNNLQIALYTY